MHHGHVFSMPPDSAAIAYGISNRGFYDFLRTYYCEHDLLNSLTYIVFFLVVMGNRSAGIPVRRSIGDTLISSLLYDFISIYLL